MTPIDPYNAKSSPTNKQRRVIGWAIVAIVTSVIIYLGINVRQELNSLTAAKSDVLQWNLSQAEVEHLTFQKAMMSVLINPDEGLSEIRTRFDVFYNRFQIINSGQLYARFVQSKEIKERLDHIGAYLETTTQLIDGSDAELMKNLPDMIAQATIINGEIRNIALNGISYFARRQVDQRQGLSSTLLGIAVLATGLLVAFLFLVWALDRLYRQNRHRAWLNDIARTRMTAIVSTSLDAIIVTRSDSRILEFNGAAERIFGYSTQHVIGKSLLSLFQFPQNAAQDMCMETFLHAHRDDNDRTDRIRVTGRNKSGDTFPAELTIAPVVGTQERVYVAYIRDISKEVQAEDELRKARDSAIAGEKSKSSLLAVMSHEMRTPLNGMLGTIELLAETKLSPPQREYLRIIRQSGSLLLSHVSNVLDISRLDAGKLELDDTRFELDSLIQDLLDSQKTLTDARNNQISAFFDADHPIMVRSDELRLRQILLNLISNANKFTENGRITVEVEPDRDKNMVEIRVVDTGIGIPPADIDRVFGDFTTLDSTYGRRVDGTGLGLGIVRRVARAMKGDITAESVEGEGSMFTLTLPILAPLTETEDAQDAPVETDEFLSKQKEMMPRAAQKLHILVVEDNEINRIVVHDFLQLDEHQVSVAEDGTTGVALAEAQKFDLILMDISMPDLDGTEVAQIIKTGDGPNRDTPIFALTAHAMEEDIERFKKAGMKKAIIKPITRKVLREALFDVSCNQNQPGAKRVLLDQDVLTEFREELGEERFQKFFAKFKSEVQQGLQELSPERLEDIAKRAHKISGSTSMFGAMRMCCALRRLETAAKAQQTDEVAEYKELVTEVWAETMVAFDDYFTSKTDADSDPHETTLAYQ